MIQRERGRGPKCQKEMEDSYLERVRMINRVEKFKNLTLGDWLGNPVLLRSQRDGPSPKTLQVLKRQGNSTRRRGKTFIIDKHESEV